MGVQVASHVTNQKGQLPDEDWLTLQVVKKWIKKEIENKKSKKQ